MDKITGRSFETLTHARLRAEQGDVRGAVRVLRAILEAQPRNGEARELLAELEGRVAIVHTEPIDEAAEAITEATTRDLAQRFRDALSERNATGRIERLSRWLERAQRNRGARHVR